MAGLASARRNPAAVGRVVLNTAVLSLLAWALVWFFASDRFYVNQIVVTGNARMPADVIRQASGLQGYSSFWIHPRQVADMLLEVLPPLESVRVSHSLSDKVVVHVEEREEQVIWQRAGILYWVDEDGRLCPVLGGAESGSDLSVASDGQAPYPDAASAQAMLLINDLGSGESAEAMSVDREVLIAAHQIMHYLPEVKELDYVPDMGLRFVHSRGWRVYLGSGDDMAHKRDLLRAVEEQLAPGTDPEMVVDLRFPRRPIRRPGSDAASEAEGN